MTKGVSAACCCGLQTLQQINLTVDPAFDVFVRATQPATVMGGTCCLGGIK
jgi:hypothetical protein